MPRGNPNMGNEVGQKTRFNGETAAKAGKKSQAAQAETRAVRATLKGIASTALYAPPLNLTKEQKKLIAKQYGIPEKEITMGHLALFKISISAANGDIAALNTIAAYAGEQPEKRVTVDTTPIEELLSRIDGECDV